MAEFKMNLDGVSAAGINQYVEPGEYLAKITSTGLEDTDYGNAVRFNFQIIEDGHKGARIDTLLYIPDDTMDEKTAAHPKAKKSEKWADNFMSLMAGKWVSLMQAAGLGEAVKDGVDARAVAKKVVGDHMVIVVQDSKKRKPTDPVFSQVNGFLPASDYDEPDTLDVDASDEDDTSDEFDLDEL